MVYKNLDLMDITSIQSVVKVDDTISGVGEGLNAGCWAVGVARYSNYLNINSIEEANSLAEIEIERRIEQTREMLRKSGAHYVIDSIVDLPAVIDDINARLVRGERP
jgi:phosphonoacetaldehyde hydrolase